MPHLEFTLLLAVLLSVAMALLGNRTLRERLYVATYLFLCCALAVVAGICGCESRLQTIGANDLFGRRVLDDQVIADRVEFISVESCEVRGLQALLQFEVEDYEAQTERCLALSLVGCQA